MTNATMTGDSKDRKPSAEMVKLIKSSLSKLMFCEVEIDLTDVCVKYGYNSGKAPTLHSAILPGKYIESILNGQKIISVEFYEPSPLFIAAEIKNGQILSYDKNLLDVPLNNTPILKLKFVKEQRLNTTIHCEAFPGKDPSVY